MTLTAPAHEAFKFALNEIRNNSNNSKVHDATYQLEVLSAAFWPEKHDLAPAVDRWADYGFEKGQIRLLEGLYSKLGKTCSYEMLMNFSLFDRDVDKWHQAKVIQVYVCRIRKKFQAMKSAYRIETIWGIGYKLVLDI